MISKYHNNRLIIPKYCISFAEIQFYTMRLLISICLLILPMMACSQLNLKGLEKTVTDKVQGKQPLTESEVVQGLKEALKVGSNNASGNASKTDGYYGNPLLKIPFPPEAVKMETKLRAIGMNKQVDDFIMKIGRAHV